MSKILEFTGKTKLNIDPDHVLEGAKGRLDTALVLGWTEAGEFYVAMSNSALGENLLLMELARDAITESVKP